MTDPDPEPFDYYLRDLQAAADLYATDVVGAQRDAISATIKFLLASNVESRLRTPLLHVFGQLQGHVGNTKLDIDSANLAAMAAVITLAKGTGMTVKQGAELVAAHIGLEHNPEIVKRLVQYRRNLLDKTRGSRDAERMYEIILSEVKARPELAPQDALNKGLELLSDRMAGASLSKVNYRALDGPRLT
jgi:hypothetical protein